jgi:ABC-type Na+ efflux pump permease subunit
MRQLFTIFKFEFFNYVKSKTFVILTSLMILIIAGILFYPRVFHGNQGAEGGDGATDAQKTVVALIDHSGADAHATAAFLSASSSSYEFVAVANTEDEIKQAVSTGEYTSALVIETPLTYKYVVSSLDMYETGIMRSTRCSSQNTASSA